MIKCPTHSPITAFKTSNCAIITLERKLALTHPPPHRHTHTPRTGGRTCKCTPTHTPMQLHWQIHTHTRRTPTRTHQCNRTAPAVLCGWLSQCHPQNHNPAEAESFHG
ncbi:hypothetical protein O181_061160 [Austropuccinia psidii MF-1]|uniref:Uncharacterized protein n=1 Tax=Austropuccinia psidii MF-1 TaxID=1389203 RepID=A0A9Q3EEN6_9BASI|nr:hypothetical protein [Austropuccinia psidii MF-1]